MKNLTVRILPVLLITLFLISGCATTPKDTQKVVIWETSDLPRAYQVLGPVSITEDVEESTGEAIQGLAAYMSKDGSMSDQLPEDMKNALKTKKMKYKEMIFEKMGEKARAYGADAVIDAEYIYVPPFVTLTRKATVSAKGTMVEYE